MGGANERAEELVADHADAILARQFENEANPTVRRETTGPEIWEATDYANEHPDELVVAVLPDTGERYLSTDLYETEADED